MQHIRRITSVLPMNPTMEATLKMFSRAPHLHVLQDHKPQVQRVITKREYYTVNGYSFPRLDDAENCKKHSVFEIQDLKENLLPRLLNIDVPRSLEEYTNIASEMFGKSSKALNYALKHAPIILLHSAFSTVHYTNEQETPLGILLSRLITLDAAIEVEEQLSQLKVEDPEFYWNMLRFISIRYMHFITELSIKDVIFYINPHDYSSRSLESHGTPEIAGIMQAYYDKTLIMNVPARAPHEPLYMVNGQPEPFYKPIVTEYKVVKTDSPVAAEEYILERHTVEEEQYYIQRKYNFREFTQYAAPESVLEDITWVYQGLVEQERHIAQSLGFPNITSAMQDPKMGYLLEHYPLQEVLELNFRALYSDPFEEIFGDDAGTFLYKAYDTPSYPLFKQFEIYRKHQYYMRVIDEIQSAVDDSGDPVLPLDLALSMSYDEILDEKLPLELNMLKKRAESTQT